MIKRFLSTRIILLWLIPFFLKAQPAKLPSEKQELLLQLSLNYYTVVKEGQVDQDSSLLLVSQKDRVSRWTVITENFGKELSQSDNKWIDTRQTGIALQRLSRLHGIDRVKHLVLLGAYYAFQPGYRQKDRDSARYFLSQAKQQSENLHSAFWTNQTLCLLGKNYFKGNQVKEGTECFKTLINNCKKTGDKAMEAKAWDYQGSYIPPSAATIKLKINSIKKANDLYQQMNQRTKQINTLMNMAYLGFLFQDLDGSEANALKALQLQNKINFPYLHYTNDILSLIYATKGNADKDLTYSLNTVKTSLSTKDSLGLAYFYARVGHVKYGQKATTYPFSNYWLRKSVEEFSKNRDPAIYRTLTNLTDNLHETGKSNEAIALLENTLKKIPPVDIIDKQQAFLSLAACYESVKNYGLAEKYYLLADALEKQDKLITKNFRSSFTKFKTAEFYFRIKRYDKTKSYLQEILATSGPKINGPDMLMQIHMMLYKVDSAQADYESAVQHLREYLKYNKSIADLNDAKNIAGMKIQFLMSQKEKDLQILQAKSALQNQQANTTRKFIYIGLSVALFIIAMLYSRYYINRKQRQAMDKKNNQLQHVINEKDELLLSKEWLLKEVHHRVKNNLHTVICLLESQAAYLENDALKAIENSQHRIYAMSLIHQKLYQSEDIKTVDMSVYLPEFIRYLSESFGIGHRIRFELDIEQLKLGASYAVPLSLIINEAVTNSIKYAFPVKKMGIITVSLHKTDEQVTLNVADNGIGIDIEKVNSTPASLGLKLLKGLSEDIKADLSIVNSEGTIITIKFRVEALMHANVA